MYNKYNKRALKNNCFYSVVSKKQWEKRKYFVMKQYRKG